MTDDVADGRVGGRKVAPDGQRQPGDDAESGGNPGRPRPEATRPGVPGASWARTVVGVGPVVYFAWLFGQQVIADRSVLTEPRLDWETALSAAAVAYLGLLLVSYWRKPPPLAERRDWRAVVATALAIDALGLSAAQPVTQPDAAGVATALMLAGTLVAFWAAWSLGRSFSLLPQARELVTSGPYRYVRHPIYLGGFLITLGEVWLRWSPLVLALNLIFVAAQVARLRYEEALLERTFPEYAEYRARTSSVLPGIA